MADSPVLTLADLPPKERGKFLAGLSDEEALSLLYDWEYWAREKQRPPEWDWFIWLILAGRGWGKTRTGTSWVHKRAMAGDKNRWIALIDKTPGDARDDMLNGPGGLLTNAPPDEKPDYNPSKRSVVWPTGAHATIYSGANPEQIRGFSGDTALCNELAAWDYPEEAWRMLLFGMRECKLADPQICITTTPKPLKFLRELRDRALSGEGKVAITAGSSYENRDNLAEVYYEEVIQPHEGTVLGDQEIHAALLDEHPDALWTRAMIRRWPDGTALPAFSRVVVGVDPAVTYTEESAEHGIVVCARDNHLPRPRGYVLADFSKRARPQRWAEAVVEAYEKFEADAVVAEVNQGGDMVRHTIHTVDADIPVKMVRATRGQGKVTRAQPISAKYEQELVYHVGQFSMLEDQMCVWVPGDDSPDRLDAMVWAFTELLIGKKPKTVRLPDLSRVSPHKVV